MLQAIRDKTSGWFATIVLGLIIVTMMFFGIEGYMQRRPDDYLARIEGPRKAFGLLAGQVQDIDQKTFRERFDRVREAERQQKGKDFDAAGFEKLANKRKVLDQLVDEALLSLAAERAGVVASDAAVVRAIQEDPSNQGPDGKFNQDTYLLRLQTGRQTSKQYEQEVRERLLKSLLPVEIASSEFASNAELESYLKLMRQTRDVRFLEIPAPPAAALPTEAEVKAWYDGHLAKYRSQESVAVEYVEIDGANKQLDTVADESALRARYEETKAKYSTAGQRLASHILVSLPPKATPAQDAAALAKATELAAKARAPGADFAALARANTDDLGSKEAGGDLGPVEKGVFGDAFDAVFFKMQPGQVSDPVKLPDGYHVLWFREQVPGETKSFEEVRPELEVEYQQEERDREFNDLAGKLIDRVDDDQGAALVPAAEELKLPVQRTSLFTRTSGEGIAALEPVRKAAFEDAQKNDRLVSDLVELEPNHVVVLHVIEVKPSAQMTLAQVHDRALADFAADRAAKAAKAHAEGILARANKGEDLDKIAAELGHPVSNVPGIARQAPNPALTPLVDAAFRLGRPVAGKFEFALAKLTPEQYALVGVTAVKDGDLTGLDAATRDKLRQQLAAGRGAVEARAYIQNLRKQYKITIAEDRL